jgi:hypothetical protein
MSLELVVAELQRRVDQRMAGMSCAGCEGPLNDASMCSECGGRYCRGCRAADQWGCIECGRYASDTCPRCMDEAGCKCGG